MSGKLLVLLVLVAALAGCASAPSPEVSARPSLSHAEVAALRLGEGKSCKKKLEKGAGHYAALLRSLSIPVAQVEGCQTFRWSRTTRAGYLVVAGQLPPTPTATELEDLLRVTLGKSVEVTEVGMGLFLTRENESRLWLHTFLISEYGGLLPKPQVAFARVRTGDGSREVIVFSYGLLGHSKVAGAFGDVIDLVRSHMNTQLVTVD